MLYQILYWIYDDIGMNVGKTFLIKSHQKKFMAIMQKTQPLSLLPGQLSTKFSSIASADAFRAENWDCFC